MNTVFFFANKEITCSPFTGRIAYLVDGNYNDRQSYTIDMNKESNETARYITVIIPVKKSTDINNISAHFTDNGYSENSVSIEVNVGGTIYPLSYTL